MGLNSSKTHRKVTKVTPMPCKEREPKQPSSVTVYSFQTLPSSFVSSSGRNPVLERQLPPLRETCYGRYPTAYLLECCCRAPRARRSPALRARQSSAPTTCSGTHRLLPLTSCSDVLGEARLRRQRRPARPCAGPMAGVSAVRACALRPDSTLPATVASQGLGPATAVPSPEASVGGMPALPATVASQGLEPATAVPSTPGPPADLQQRGREERSIIKQHPPRRLQKLEPFILADNIPASKCLNLQGGTLTQKEKLTWKEIGRGEQVAKHPVGRRQYLLQMKMLEIRKEAELKRRLQQEARLNKPKMRDLHLLGTLEYMQGTRSSDEEEQHSIEHEQTFNGSHALLKNDTFGRKLKFIIYKCSILEVVIYASQFFLYVYTILKFPLLVLLGDLWHREFLKESGSPKSHLDQREKVETWLLKQQATMESSSDASSIDTNNWSDCNDIFRKPYRRPALVRTKTERMTLFDDFFDKEL
ncbi:factor associated with metabolism and energy [Vipera latastei]